MKITINKNYITYGTTVLILLIDAASLILIKNNALLSIAYFLLNLLLISVYCLKCSNEDSAIFSIIFMLFYTFFIDIFIHYFDRIIIFEMEFLFVLPVLITCLKIKNKNSKTFFIASAIYIIFNATILLICNKVDIVNYLIFMVNIFSFLAFYYVYSNLKVTKKHKDLYIFIFALSAILTIIQTGLGFNEDTRNGVFSVFGWGAYTFFIMIFLMYNFNKYIMKEKGFMYMVVIAIICSILYICTESKAALIIMFINMVLLIIVKKGLTYKQVLLLVMGVVLIPISYKLLIYFTPKFAHLKNINNIIRYFIGNNNTRYQFGRFEALKNVIINKPFLTKMFGIGFGSSCPLYKVFFEELGRNPIYPYYINIYGYKYGYQHTSSAILLLDGGILLFSAVVIFIINKLRITVKNIRTNIDNTIDVVRFGILIYLIYYFAYANVLKDFRIMALLGIMLGICKIEDKKQFGGEMNV